MATLEEKTDLIETIKRPIRYYKLQLCGYGGESVYINLTKDAYEYWNQRIKEEGNNLLTEYMLDEDREEFPDIPLEADFMRDTDDPDGLRYPWHDAPGVFEHVSGVEFSNARIIITEVDSMEYEVTAIGDDVIDTDLEDYLDELMEEDDYTSELIQMDCSNEGDGYICQFYSSEKGAFYEGTFESKGLFNPRKLKVVTTEYPNGDNVVTSVEYDKVHIENVDGDTIGKGYSAHIWQD